MSFDFGVEFSQDSDLTEEEVVNLVEESKATNTKKCTSWGLLRKLLVRTLFVVL